MFQTYTLTQVPRAENAHADVLTSLGSALDYQLKRSILVEYLEKPSIDDEPAIEMAQIIIDYIFNGTLIADN